MRRVCGVSARKTNMNNNPKTDQSSDPSRSGETPRPITERLRWVKSFIEYARYELQPGESRVGDQFPRQADADKAIATIADVLGELTAVSSLNGPITHDDHPSDRSQETPLELLDDAERQIKACWKVTCVDEHTASVSLLRDIVRVLRESLDSLSLKLRRELKPYREQEWAAAASSLNRETRDWRAYVQHKGDCRNPRLCQRCGYSEGLHVNGAAMGYGVCEGFVQQPCSCGLDQILAADLIPPVSDPLQWWKDRSDDVQNEWQKDRDKLAVIRQTAEMLRTQTKDGTDFSDVLDTIIELTKNP